MLRESDLEEQVEKSKIKNCTLETRLRELQECYETKTKRQIALSDRMVAGHRRMVAESEAYVKRLKLNRDENFRYKFVEQWLTAKAKELTGGHGVTANDRSRDPAKTLEVSLAIFNFIIKVYFYTIVLFFFF